MRLLYSFCHILAVTLLAVTLLAGTVVAGEGIDPNLRALALEPNQISFLHQENVEPWDVSPCQHKLSSVGLFEWDIVCLKNGVFRKYGVHLVVNRYPKTRLGGAGYELLYWVTDWTDPRNPKSTSTTMFIHMLSTEDRAQVIEVANGIENDFASLRLIIDLR